MSSTLQTLQTFWDWRAAGNFIGGGTGSGLFIAVAIAVQFDQRPLLFAIVGLGLIVVGLSLVWTELGRPWRFLNVFAHAAKSWMTREAFAAIPLMFVGLAAMWFANEVLLVLGAILALIFLYCQARMLHGGKGIPAWRAPISIPLLIITGLAEGLGAFFLISVAVLAIPDSVTFVSAPGPVAIKALTWLLLLMIVLRLVVWQAYRESLSQDDGPAMTVKILDGFSPWFVIVGHAIPAILCLATLWLPAGGNIALFIAGGCVMIAGWRAKLIIVTKAAYKQGYAIKHRPIVGRNI